VGLKVSIDGRNSFTLYSPEHTDGVVYLSVPPPPHKKHGIHQQTCIHGDQKYFEP